MAMKFFLTVGQGLAWWAICGSGIALAGEATVLQVLPGEGRPSTIMLGTGVSTESLVPMPTTGELIVASGVRDGALPARPESPRLERGRWQTATGGGELAKDPAVGSWLGAVAQLPAKRPPQSRPAPIVDNGGIEMQDVVRTERSGGGPAPVGASPASDSPVAGPGENAPAVDPPVADVALRLELNEISLLRDAASRAGGRLDWTIKLVGVKAEDLLIPLANSGQVRVFQDPSKPGRWVIASLSRDDREAKIRDEITRLEARRRDLLAQVQSLETLAGRVQR